MNFRSYFPLFTCIFAFLKKKTKDTASIGAKKNRFHKKTFLKLNPKTLNFKPATLNDTK